MSQNNVKYHSAGAISMWCCFMSIANPTINIRQSHDNLIFIMEILLPDKMTYIETSTPKPAFYGHMATQVPLRSNQFK